MSANQIPENMGKKIVEALKKQALFEEDDDIITQDEVIEEPTVSEIKEDPEVSDPVEQPVYTQHETPMQFSIPTPSQEPSFSNVLDSELPANVAVLKNLILQLPAGVSKQVGAQIIRQTIEALGISMNSVLQEAQDVQDELNKSIADCSLKIQEYKNQILQLEATAKDCQRQMTQLNDLISLFILTDKKR
ncbi:MAG: hypothetical protein ACI4B8_07305 [Candidatus Gastranaerophilaceae bacterium]